MFKKKKATRKLVLKFVHIDTYELDVDPNLPESLVIEKMEQDKDYPLPLTDAQMRQLVAVRVLKTGTGRFTGIMRIEEV